MTDLTVHGPGYFAAPQGPGGDPKEAFFESAMPNPDEFVLSTYGGGCGSSKSSGHIPRQRDDVWHADLPIGPAPKRAHRTGPPPGFEHELLPRRRPRPDHDPAQRDGVGRRPKQHGVHRDQRPHSSIGFPPDGMHFPERVVQQQTCGAGAGWRALQALMDMEIPSH